VDSGSIGKQDDEVVGKLDELLTSIDVIMR
jgi:hypothetical protein